MDRDTAFKVIDLNVIDVAITNGMFDTRSKIQDVFVAVDNLRNNVADTALFNTSAGRIQFVIDSNLGKGIYKTVRDVTIVINAFNMISNQKESPADITSEKIQVAK